MTQDTAKLKVQRGGPAEAPVFEDFEVPYREGMSVLDALIWVRANVDSSLAIRYSCTNANTCKECMVKVEAKRCMPVRNVWAQRRLRSDRLRISACCGISSLTLCRPRRSCRFCSDRIRIRFGNYLRT